MLKLIVCTAKNNLIGDKNPQGNGLLWHSKSELLHYKNLTLNNIVLFGKTTTNVVPIELMKKTREVVILDRDTDINKILHHGISSNKDIFICGGLTIYEYFLKYFQIDEIIISRLKDHITVEKPITPLYFPDVLNYGYILKNRAEHDDFFVETYIKEDIHVKV